MFQTTFFKEDLAMIIHEEDTRATRALLEDPRAAFVWGELMDPHFIHNLLGNFLPFAPCWLEGFRRVRTETFFDLEKAAGESVQGVAILGMSDEDMAKLDEFEKEGDLMRRTEGRVHIGHFSRSASIYVKI